MSFGRVPPLPAHQVGNPMQPQRDRSVEAARGPRPAVPRVPRARARSNSAGAISRAIYSRPGSVSRPGSASSKGSHDDGRLSRAGSGVLRDESPRSYARVNALQRHDEAQEQRLSMGPAPRPGSRPGSAHSGGLDVDYRRGRSLSVGLEPSASTTGPDGTPRQPAPRRCVLDRETQKEEQGLEFFPKAASTKTGRPSNSGRHQRVNYLDREMLETNEVPERKLAHRTGSTGRPSSGGPEFARKNVLADEVKRAAPSCGLPKPPCYDGDMPQYARRALLGRHQDIGFSTGQLSCGGA